MTKNAKKQKIVINGINKKTSFDLLLNEVFLMFYNTILCIALSVFMIYTPFGRVMDGWLPE